MDDGRKWHLAWAQLDAFFGNLPNAVKEKHVAEYHAILDLLHESSGEEIDAFRIPDAEVKPVVTSIRMATYRRPGSATYSTEKYCDRDLMLRKIESVRNYFTRIQPPEMKPRLGF